MSATPGGLFRAVLSEHPDRPLVTWYDETPGRTARVELSARSLANWAAKTAGLLADELGLGPGETVLVEPVPHWLTLGVLAGVWHAGLAVTTGGPGSNGGAAQVDAAFVARPSSPLSPGTLDAPEVFTLDPASPLQLGAPDDAPGAPPGSRDLPTALRPHPDRLGPSNDDPGAAALDGVDGADLAARAWAQAAALGLRPDVGRLLWSGGLRVADAAVDPIVDAVLAPWAVGGSLVLVTGLDPSASKARLAAIAAAEAADVMR